MAASEDIRLRLAREVLDAAAKDFERTLDTWKGLEGKAQATVAVAGIFIGGTFAIVRDMGGAATLHRVLAGAVVALLVAAVLSAVMALRIRFVTGPPSAANLQAVLADLFALTDAQMAQRELAYVQDRIRLWRAGIDEHDRANQAKARWIGRAQVCLLLAILAAAGLVMAMLVGGRPESGIPRGGPYEVHQNRMRPDSGREQQLLPAAPAETTHDVPRRDGPRSQGARPVPGPQVAFRRVRGES